MTTQTTKAAGRIGGLPMGDSLGGRAWLSDAHHTPGPRARQIVSPRLTALQDAWQLARAEGDRDGYWLARRLYLLEQARLYQAGEVGR